MEELEADELRLKKEEEFDGINIIVTISLITIHAIMLEG